MPLNPDSTLAPMYDGVAIDDEVPGALQLLLFDVCPAANAAGYTTIMTVELGSDTYHNGSPFKT